MALREIFATFGFAYDKAKLQEITRGVEGVKNSAKAAGGSGGLDSLIKGLQGAAALLAGNVFFQFTNQIKTQAAELMDLSEQTGIATDELQAWTLAANLGGASAQDFTAGLRKLSKELATGVDESGQQSKLFKTLGIDAKDGAGNVRELSDVLPEIADKFAGLRTGAEKSALAQQIFGKAGSKLVPILSQGAAGVARLKAQFEELGGGFSKEAIEQADAYDDALIKLNFSFFGLKSLIANSVFPILTNLVATITKASVGASKWFKETTLLGNGVKALAAVLTGKLLLALAPFLLPGLKFVAIFLAVDDLLAFLDGKESVIGDILNRWFGNGTADSVRAWCNSAKEAIVGTFMGALDLLRIAFASTDAEQQKLWEHFELATRPVERAIDAIIEKLNVLLGIFDAEVLLDGANDLLDLVTDPFDSAEDKAAKAQRRAARKDAKLPQLGAGSVATAGTATEAAPFSLNFRDDSGPADPRSFVPKPATIGPPVVNNISPVQVTQTFGPGTPADVRKAAETGSRAGVAAGLAEYRSALQGVEQRAP